MLNTSVIRLLDEPQLWLDEKAQWLGLSRSEMGATLIEEARRQEEFPGIGFRDADFGREAYLPLYDIDVRWIMVMLVGWDMDVDQTADDLDVPREAIELAVRYEESFGYEVVLQKSPQVRAAGN